VTDRAARSAIDHRIVDGAAGAPVLTSTLTSIGPARSGWRGEDGDGEGTGGG
jgi:hypothetical protein